MPVVLLAVGSAAAYAVAATLKHISAGRAPDASALTGRAVARFVRATLTHRLFLLSVLVDLTAAALQILALRRGALSVVQPLLVSGLVVALGLRAWTSGRVRRRDLAWGLLLVASLAAFLGVARISQTRATADAGPAAAMGAVGLLVVVGCVVLARRRRGRAGPASLLGFAVGVANASTAAMLKALTAVAAGGLGALLGAWQSYVLVLLVPLAMVLNQMAFQAGPLTASLPVTSSVDPLVSLLVGVVVFDETVRHGPVTLPLLIALLAVLVTAVAALARSAAVADGTDRGVHQAHTSATRTAS